MCHTCQYYYEIIIYGGEFVILQNNLATSNYNINTANCVSTDY
jgi:hypothetical protein